MSGSMEFVGVGICCIDEDYEYFVAMYDEWSIKPLLLLTNLAI